jgi:hypothetical protein
MYADFGPPSVVRKKWVALCCAAGASETRNERRIREELTQRIQKKQFHPSPNAAASA